MSQLIRSVADPNWSVSTQDKSLWKAGSGLCGGQLCPVAAVLAWMVMRGTLMGQPLFYFSDGSTLTRQRFVTELWKALRSNGEYPRAVLGLVPLLLLLSRVLETPPSNCLVGGESQPISSVLRHHHPAWLCTPEPCHSKCPEWQTRLAQVSPDKWLCTLMVWIFWTNSVYSMNIMCVII